VTLSLGEEKIRVKYLEKITKEDMAGKLTCDLGVGVGELVADDDLVRLHPVEVTAGFGKLAEEVTDVAFGTLVQGLEVGGDLSGGISTEMRRWSGADLRFDIDKKNDILPKAWTKRRRGAGRTLAGAFGAGHLLRRRRRG
jgi:hypothetical protein